MNAAAVEVQHREVRFPTQAVVQRQLLSDLPRIGAVQAQIPGALGLFCARSHGELGRVAEEKVGHAQSNCLTVEGHAARRVRIRVGIHPPQRGACANRELMVSFEYAEVVGACKSRELGGTGLHGVAPPAGHVEVWNVRVVAEHFDSHIGQSRLGLCDIFGTGLTSEHSICG